MEMMGAEFSLFSSEEPFWFPGPYHYVQETGYETLDMFVILDGHNYFG